MSGVSLYIEGSKIDLSDKEGINIKLNTQDINDISKVNAGYSKDFSVQATPSNNKFFKHYYNADITGGFDARTKKKATIYLDDLFFISGRIRLTSTALKNNLIVSYRIQFEGDVVNVKDVLGDKKLSDLDLSQFNHDYTSNNVLQGLGTSLSNGSVIYPLISSSNRFLYDSSDAYQNTLNSKNIHYNANNIDNAISYNELKPALKVADIINQIQIDNDLTFIGDFFNRDYYNNLFMWFSNNEGFINFTNPQEESLVDFNAGDFTFINQTTNKLLLSYPSQVENNSSRFELFMRDITPKPAYLEAEYSYFVVVDGLEVYREDNLKGVKAECRVDLYQKDYNNKNVEFYIQSNNAFEYSSTLEQRRFDYGAFPSLRTDVFTQANNGGLISDVVLQNQAPDLKQIDLIIGIIKMFNIALTANENGEIIWQTLPDWYSEGIEYKNFEKYIDLDKTVISRGKLNNEFDFKYEDPSTILAIQYEKNNIDAYGDLQQRLTEDLNNPDSELLDGSKLEISLPFENMVYERLRDLATNENIGFQYGLAVDDSLNSTVPKPVLFYNNSNTPPQSIGFKDENNNLLSISFNLNTPNNTNSLTDNTKQSINFSAELSTYNFGVMPNTLYSAFYSDYITDMFNNQRRVYVFDAIIPNFILANIKLNDRLIIANKRYIINSINSNLTTGKTKLELLNDIYEGGELTGEQFYAVPNFFNVAVGGEDIESIVYNNGLTVNSLIDEGFGIFTSITTVTPFTGTKTLGMIVPTEIIVPPTGMTIRGMSFNISGLTTSQSSNNVWVFTKAVELYL